MFSTPTNRNLLTVCTWIGWLKLIYDLDIWLPLVFLRLFQLKMVQEIIQEDAMYEDKFQVKQLHHIWCRPLEASKETYHMSVERFISWRQRTHQTSSTVFLNLRSRLNRMDWLAVLGATGPTTLPLLCVPLRMNSVCRLQWVFGTQQGFPAMAALRTSSAVVPQKSSMAEFRCLQPWDTSPQNLLGNSLASCLHLPAWSLQMFPMDLQQSPKCQQQAGLRSRHTWPSAKFPKTSPLEPQPLLETLDGSSSHRMTQRWRKPSLMQSWQTAVWPWWLSSGCFFQARFSNWMEVMISVRAFDCHVFYTDQQESTYCMYMNRMIEIDIRSRYIMITSSFFLRLFQLKMVQEIIQEDAMYEDKFQVKQLHHIWCRPLEASKETYHMFLERFISWRQRTHQTSSHGFLNLRSRLNRMDWLAVLGGDWANYTASPLRAFENELGVQAPVGFWDPAGLSSDGSVENFKRRRATEIKHGRISMLATMGYITPELTGKFPGFLSPSAGLKFADVPNGLAAISKVPAAGWAQIAAYMAFCEVSQDQSPGTAAFAGDFGWKLITSDDPEVKKTKLNAELANGRLAMMAIIGMFFQARFSNGIGVVIPCEGLDCNAGCYYTFRFEWICIHTSFILRWIDVWMVQKWGMLAGLWFHRTYIFLQCVVGVFLYHYHVHCIINQLYVVLSVSLFRFRPIVTRFVLLASHHFVIKLIVSKEEEQQQTRSVFVHPLKHDTPEKNKKDMIHWWSDP